jgi:hypothetical protein
MIDYKATFKRYEIKYILTLQQAYELKKLMMEYMIADKYGNSTICNIYFDTPDFLLIRRSMDKPFYKEKLRLRSYGVSSHDGTVYAELKKKYDSVVYKRRIDMKESDAMKCLAGDGALPDCQIGREIGYCFERYKGLAPRVFLSYERQAFFGKDNEDFRMTFDKNIIWRDYDLSLCKGVYGNSVLRENQVLLEVKIADALPLWLVKFFSEHKIYKSSFSKYGAAYCQMISGNKQKTFATTA